MNKKKFTLPRVTWHIKPITKVKDSHKAYDRKKEKTKLTKEWD